MALLNALIAACAGKRPQPQTLLDYLGMVERDFSSHIFLCGQTGSGKSTVLRLLLKAILNAVSPGAIHACVKPDEAPMICELILNTHMRNRLFRFIPGTTRFNVASYECGRAGGSPASLTRLLQALNEQRQRSRGSDGEKSFWKNLFTNYMQFGCTIAWLAHGPSMTLEHVHQVITTCATSIEDKQSQRFLGSPCWTMLKLARDNVKNAKEGRQLDRATEFYLEIQCSLGDKARMAGVQECSSILGIFLLDPFYDSFCASESDWTPETPLDGYYVVLDFPVMVHAEEGQLCQSFLTMLAVDAALRQPNPKHYTLVVRDELQLLVADPLKETLAHSVARSQKLCFISAVQNLPLLSAAFGGDIAAEQQWKSLLGNYVTKFVLANGCMDTNHYFSSLFGEHKEQFHSFNERQPTEATNFGDALFGQDGFSFGSSENYHSRVPPDSFSHLRRGGPPDWLIDAYMSQSGRVFSSGLPYKLVTFTHE